MGAKPEIMSPAGYWPQLRAAIEAGADAVYFGLKHFTARAKVGFSLEELPEAMAALHGRGVKGYVTFNTLVFDHELDAAARAIGAIAEAGADAIIVQDLGVLKLARRIAPGLPLHGSTQMSVTSADGVRLAQELGATRVTLARELSLAEVRRIGEELAGGSACPTELEIFVHGALCVAYSGQCLSSEAWGGRSANRGQCAQACRLPYEMVVDGAVAPLGDARYLLSPGDLNALRQIPEIVAMGIAAIKIEGRYKDAAYVALATRAYRQAVDQVHVSAVEELQLEQVYSRGSGPFFLTGTNHQAVVKGRAPRHRGVQMGRVAGVTFDAVMVEPSPANSLAPLKPGDGVVFDAAAWSSPQEDEEGGRVYQAAARDGVIELRFGNGVVNTRRIRAGDLVWRTHDPNVDKAARAYLDPAAPVRKQAVRVRVTARVGAPLETEWMVGDLRVAMRSDGPLGMARERALTVEYLTAQLGRLGNTAYELAGVELDVEGSPFAPSSMLNELRRRAVEELGRVQARKVERASWPAFPAEAPRPKKETSQESRPGGLLHLHLLVRTAEQLDAAIALRPASITLDYLDLYGLRPSLERIRSVGLAARVASPRVLKPGERKVVDFLLGCGCPILVRPAGLLHALRGREHAALIGDFSLNAANAVAAEELLALGLDMLTPAHDLNAAQVAELARNAGAERIEVVAYQHLPVFHTEHCVFCRFLSTGTSYLDCGRPCEKHRVELRDTAGRAHPVMADVGCRNTVFGAEAQHAGAHLEAWRAAGIEHFRLEFAHESAAQVAGVTGAFAEALNGRCSPRELAARLQRLSPEGITEGSLYVPADYLALPVLQ